MIPIRDNTTTIWVVGAIILANMFMLHDRIWGFLLWMCFAFFIIILDLLRLNNELKMMRRHLELMKRAKTSKRIRKKR